MKKINGYGYVRVSTDRQEELSPDSQEKLLREYAKKNNIILLEVFHEIGISGRKADKRPEFQRMISMAKSKDHPIDTILVWKFSRFARNQEESIVYKSLLKRECDVDVISISEPLIEGPFGTLIERIIEWMDEYYSIRLGGEVKRGMNEKALRGGYQTTPCLGYNAVGHGKPFVINEEEYKIYQYISDQFDIYNKDATAIARNANELGYRTKKGNLFEARTVTGILRNNFYIGIVEWNGHVFKGSHEVRMDESRFNERITRLDSLYHPKSRRNLSGCRHWLGGIIKCPICGASLGYNASRTPGTPSFFQCWKYSKGIHRQSISISEKKLINSVYKNFEDILNGKDFSFHYMPPASQTGNELNDLKKKLEKLSVREWRIRDAYENEIDTLEEYRDNKFRLNDDKNLLLEKISSLENAIVPSKEAYLEKIKTVYDAIKDPEIDYITKGNLMRSIVEDIVYDKEHQQLLFHFYYS